MKPARVVALVTLASIVSTAGADEPAATPYRPTVANPAELSVPGWLEIETGLLRTRNGDAQRRAVPYTAKFAFDTDWGLLLGGEARIVQKSPDRILSGGGDTSLTLKHRIATDDENINFGVEAGSKFPTARTGLGSGERDWTINGIASVDLVPAWRLDVNLGATRLGTAAEGQGRQVAQWAASLSRGIGRWSLAAELSGTRQSGLPDGRQWLVAAGYSVAPRIVLDAGTALNRQGAERQRSHFFGVTWLAGKFY